jgi:hypothetical protein
MNDKTKHFLVGCAFGMSALGLSYLLPFWWVLVVTFVTSSVVFFGKEVKDIPTTGFDKMDLLADYAGLIAGYIIAFIAYNAIQIMQL